MKLENYKIMKCPECNENVIYCINKDMSYNFDILKK